MTTKESSNLANRRRRPKRSVEPPEATTSLAEEIYNIREKNDARFTTEDLTVEEKDPADTFGYYGKTTRAGTDDRQKTKFQRSTKHPLPMEEQTMQMSDKNSEPEVKAKKKQVKKQDDRNENLDRLVFSENVKFEKLDAGDYRFGPVVSAAKFPVDRNKKSSILLEGQRLVAEGVAASLNFKAIYFTQVELLVGLPLEKLIEAGMKLYKVSSKHMKVWSDTVMPAGIMAVCKLPVVEQKKTDFPLPLTLVCDRIQDPGYLGTILRSAAAAGCAKVLVTKGSIDPWQPKVLRAGMGAHFHIPIVCTGWELITNYLSSDSDTDIFLVSNKTSVDAKGSIVPHDSLKEAMLQNEDDDPSKIINKDYFRRKKTKAFEWVQLTNRCYETVNYGKAKHVAVVIGNEDGPSNEAKKYAYTCRGQTVFVPGAHQLSPAITSSIVLFEVSRQLKHKNEDDVEKFN